MIDAPPLRSHERAKSAFARGCRWVWEASPIPSAYLPACLHPPPSSLSPRSSCCCCCGETLLKVSASLVFLNSVPLSPLTRRLLSSIFYASIGLCLPVRVDKSHQDVRYDTRVHPTPRTRRGKVSPGSTRGPIGFDFPSDFFSRDLQQKRSEPAGRRYCWSLAIARGA